MWGVSGYRVDPVTGVSKIRDQLGQPHADPNEAFDNFVDRDPDRFYIRIADRAKNQKNDVVERVTAKVGVVPDRDNMTEVTLEETAADSGVFVSKSQLLVMADLGFWPNDTAPPAPEPYPKSPRPYQDDAREVHDGFAGGAVVSDDAPGDRTHQATLTDAVRVEYAGQPVETPVLRNEKVDERKLLEVRVTVLNEHDKDISGDGVRNTVLGTQQTARDYAKALIDRANVLWSQAGIEVRQVGNVKFINAPNNAQNANVLADGIIDRQDTENAAGDAVANPSETVPIARKIVEHFGMEPDVRVRHDRLELVIVGPMRKDTRGRDGELEPAAGYTLPSSYQLGAGNPFQDQGENTFVFVSNETKVGNDLFRPIPLRFNVLAHEIGHALTNRQDEHSPSHVLFPRFGSVPDHNNLNRRLTKQTVEDARRPRKEGAFDKTGSRLLKDWSA